MSKLILLGVVLLMGVLFAAVPVGDGKIGFVFVEGSIRVVDYIYFVMEHVIKIILCYVIYAEAVKYRTALFIFLWIQVADLADFCLTFNNPWFHVGIIPVTMNTVGIVIFTFAILNDD